MSEPIFIGLDLGDPRGDMSVSVPWTQDGWDWPNAVTDERWPKEPEPPPEPQTIR